MRRPERASRSPGTRPGRLRRAGRGARESRRARSGGSSSASAGVGLRALVRDSDLRSSKLLAQRWGGSASIGNREGGGARAEVVLPVDEAVEGAPSGGAGAGMTRLVALGLLGLVDRGRGRARDPRPDARDDRAARRQLEQGASLAPPAARAAACRDDEEEHDDARRPRRPRRPRRATGSDGRPHRHGRLRLGATGEAAAAGAAATTTRARLRSMEHPFVPLRYERRAL